MSLLESPGQYRNSSFESSSAQTAERPLPSARTPAKHHRKKGISHLPRHLPRESNKAPGQIPQTRLGSMVYFTEGAWRAAPEEVSKRHVQLRRKAWLICAPESRAAEGCYRKYSYRKPLDLSKRARTRCRRNAVRTPQLGELTRRASGVLNLCLPVR